MRTSRVATWVLAVVPACWLLVGGCVSPPPAVSPRPVAHAADWRPAAAPLPADRAPVAAPAPEPPAAPPAGAIPGSKNHPDDFARPITGGCRCSGDVDMAGCRCLHCGREPGSLCYCDQGEPRCLCGLDMAGCRCTHCAGREGGVCPCDHSKTREELERRHRRGD